MYFVMVIISESNSITFYLQYATQREAQRRGFAASAGASCSPITRLVLIAANKAIDQRAKYPANDRRYPEQAKMSRKIQRHTFSYFSPFPF